MALMRTTAEWKWEKEMVDLLWSLTKTQDKQKEAIQQLYRYYERADNTQGLYRVLVRWEELEPEDLNVQNNLAQISLLLDANADDARRVAADLHKKDPSNAAYTTTYAYSLLTKGNAKEAAKVMDSLTADQLRDPAVSAYYGICLAAVHDEKAREFLAAGQKASLLPEEKKLVDKAFASLDSWRRIR
jgi:Flp pilus assembly protein TadD